jgi:hypothetical protein
MPGGRSYPVSMFAELPLARCIRDPVRAARTASARCSHCSHCSHCVCSHWQSARTSRSALRCMQREDALGATKRPRAHHALATRIPTVMG